MKISELISELEVLWAEHGDLEVRYPDPQYVQFDNYDPYVSL